jgi:protocatechuate 3,4-dioxygenase, alpha subunit
VTVSAHVLQTPSQTVGPFFHQGMIFGGENVLVDGETRGEHIRLTGRVLDGNGTPIEDAMLEIWQPDAGGIFPHPADPNAADADPHFKAFGRADTAPDGRYTFETVKPGALAAEGATRGIPYINVRIFARGLLIHAVTRVYFADEDNGSDPVFRQVPDHRRHTLLARRDDRASGATYVFDVRLQGDDETVFFDL